MRPRSRIRRLATSALWVGLLLPLRLDAQSIARVRAEENIRREPNGEVLARVLPGSAFDVVDRNGRWLQISLEGWVWARSLQVSSDALFDLVVSEPQGENLRDGPSGTILARLGRGMLLEELERTPGWIRVRRRAWVWSASVAETSATPAEAPLARPSAGRPGGFTTAGANGATILVAPDGDTLARTIPRAELAVVAREGNWARVRLEGWTWMPEDDAVAVAEDDVTGALTPDQLAAEPERHRGRVVVWDLQFISLERAERVRTDFFEGEPFLLTRYGGPDGPFVYVSVPPERVGEVGGLVPLERLQVTARVRTGASALTETPIVDLISLERSRDR